MHALPSIASPYEPLLPTVSVTASLTTTLELFMSGMNLYLSTMSWAEVTVVSTYCTYKRFTPLDMSSRLLMSVSVVGSAVPPLWIASAIVAEPFFATLVIVIL